MVYFKPRNESCGVFYVEISIVLWYDVCALHKLRIDMNSCRILDMPIGSMCAVALDMLLSQREFISYRVLSKAKNISIL